MDVFEKINKGVGLAATAIIIGGATPQVAHAMTNVENPPKIQAKSICKDIEKSIKNGTYEIDKLKVNVYPNVNVVSKKDSKLMENSKIKSVQSKEKKDVSDNESKEKSANLNKKQNHEQKTDVKPTEKETKSEVKTVGIRVLKAENDEESMSGSYIEKEVKYIKKNGKIYCEIKLLATDWMKNIKVNVDGKEVKHVVNKIGKTEVMGMNHEGGIVRFEVPKINPNITFHMYVEPMKCDVAFRIVGEKQSEEQVKPQPQPQVKPVTDANKPKPVKPDTKPNEQKEKPSNVDTKPNEKQTLIDVKKPGNYKAECKIELKDPEVQKLIKKHLALDENQNVNLNLNVENQKIYVVLKIIGKVNSINKINVNGAEIKFEVVGQSIEKQNRLAFKNMITSKNNKNAEESSTIKFEVPDEKANINIKMHDKDVNKDFGVMLKLDNIKAIDEQSKPQTNTNSVDNNVKPTKPSNDELNKDKTSSKDKKEITKQIKVKALKENSNEPSMAEKYLDTNITYTEKDEKKYFTVTLDKIDWMKNIQISVDGKSVTYNKETLGEKAHLTFEVPSENCEVIFRMNVVPMGNARVAFRVVNVNSGSTSHSAKQSTSKETTKKDKEKKKDKRKDELKIDANKHGMYRVDVDILKSDSDENSMAGQYLNSSCKYEVKGDKKYFTLTFNRMDWMKNISIYVNDDKKDYDTKSIGKNRSELKFETDGIGAVIEVKMNVVPMGNSRVTFRVLPKKSSLELLDEYKEDSSKKDETKANDKNNNPKAEKDKKTDENDSKNQSKDNTKDDLNNKTDGNNQKDKETSDAKQTSENKDDVASANKEKEGLYEVGIKTLKENSNEPSMAGTYLGDKINIQLKNGKKYGIVKLNKSNWMKDINVLVNGKDQKYEIVNIKSLDNGEKSTTIKFEIPDLSSEIKFKMNVEPMGNARVTFRVQIQKDTLKFLQSNEYDATKAEEYLNDLVNKQNKNIENKNQENMKNTDKTANEQIKEKKLPRTGLPFGGGAMAAIGSVLSGLGITLMRKNIHEILKRG